MINIYENKKNSKNPYSIFSNGELKESTAKSIYKPPKSTQSKQISINTGDTKPDFPKVTGKPEAITMIGDPNKKTKIVNALGDPNKKPKITKLPYYNDGNKATKNIPLYTGNSKTSSLGTLIQKPVLSEGARIKSRVKDILAKQEGELNVRHIFDDIDDKTVENYIPLAQTAINNNLLKGRLTSAQLEKLPNLFDGLTMFYAAGEKGNPKAERLARKVAYTEVEGKQSEKNTLQSKTEDFQTKEYPSFEDVLAEYKKIIATKSESENSGNLYNAEPHTLVMDANTVVEPQNALLTKEMIDNGALEMQKLSGKVSFNLDDINEIISRAEELSGSLSKEERSLLEEVLKNGTLPLYNRKRIERVLNKSEVGIKEDPFQSEPRDNDNKSIFSQIGDSIKANSEVKDQIANAIIDDVLGSWLPSKTLSVVDSLNGYINSMVDNSKIAKKIVNYIFNGDEEYSSGNPSENYIHNKTIDLKKTGALSNGYINYQSRLDDYKFGVKNIDYGGCGIIALYNVLKGMGKQKEFSDLIYENEESALIKGGLGISPNGISKYLKNAGFEVSHEYLDVNQYSDYSDYDAVIHLYFRNDGSAHYVAGISNGDGTFCFYNSDANSTRPMTWEEYFKKANENTDMVYSCTYNVKRK